MPTPRTRSVNVDKVAISLDRRLLEWIDQQAGTAWGARSRYLAELLIQDMERHSQSGGPRVREPLDRIKAANVLEEAEKAVERIEKLSKTRKAQLAKQNANWKLSK